MKKTWIILFFLGLCWNPISFLIVRVGEAAELGTKQPSKSSTISTIEKDIDLGLEGYPRGKSNVRAIEDVESDHEGNQAQSYIQIGLAAIKTSFTNSWDNLTIDSDRYRTSAIQIDTPMNYDTPTLPLFFSISYTQNTSQSTLAADRWGTQGSIEHIISGSLCYSRDDVFDATVSSSYSLEKDQLHASENVEFLSQEIGVSIWPTENLSITPTASYSEYRYPSWDEEWIKAPSASLYVTFYGLFEAMDLSLSGAYSRERDTHGYQDGRTLTTSLEMSWDSENIFFRKVQFSFELAHEKYEDKVSPEYSYEGFLSFLSLKIPF